MTKPTKKLIGLALVSSLALSACSPDIGKQASRGDVSAHIDAVNAQIDEDGSRLQKLTATGRPANIRVRDGLYLGRDGFRTGRGDPLPRRFESDAGISMNLAESLELREFALELRRITGLRIDYRDLANTPPLRGTILEAEEASSQNSGVDSTGMGTAVPATATEAEETDHPLSINFRVNYTGPLSGLLDQVAAQVGADWEYKGGRIKFLGAQTVTYTVWALPGAIKSESTIGAGGSSSVFGGSSPASTSRSVEMDYWEEIEAGLGAIIPSDGSVYSLNKTTGTIVLTSYQNIHERVAEFVERENARLSRQVAVKVDLLAFSESKSDNRSTNLQLALNDVADGIGGTFTTSPNNIDDAIGIGTTILGTSESDSGSGGINTNLSGWKDDMAGSSAIINALSKKGKVALLNSVSVMAMNNAPTPVAIMKEKAYLAGTTTEINDEGEETTELETGVINNGINIVMTPRIMRSGDVNIDYTLNLSQLIGMDSFESQGMMVQLPEVETRNFMQSVNLASGDTMVIAAYDSRRTERAGSGPFDPRFWGLGGQDGFSTDTTKILVLMTPVVVEKQNAPRLRH